MRPAVGQLSECLQFKARSAAHRAETPDSLRAGDGDGIVPATFQPSERMQSATLSIANLCASGSRTIPPCPRGRARPQTAAFTRTTASVSSGAAAKTGESSSVAEITQRPLPSRNLGAALFHRQRSRLKKRALMRSSRRTRESVAQLHGNLAETGIDGGHVTAPCCKRQSVNPPVEAPTSRQARPCTVMGQCSSAAASLSPPRLT